MRELDEGATLDHRTGVAWEDGLMMSMIAANPVRLENVHASRIGVHLSRMASGYYHWKFGKSEVKNGERLDAELPGSLNEFLDRWLQEVRPFLLRGKSHDAMWVTSLGNPMSRTTIYTRFCDATEDELDVRINPQAVRHIAATSIAVSMPESVRMFPFILSNSDRVAQEHYNLADGLSASRRYLEGLERRRQQALAMTRARSTKK